MIAIERHNRLARAGLRVFADRQSQLQQRFIQRAQMLLFAGEHFIDVTLRGLQIRVRIAHLFAWWLAERSVGKGEEMGDPDAYLQAAEKYVDQMFAGKKEHLKPLYNALLRLGLSMGKDTKACPCQTIVPLYRNHVF